MNSFLFLKKEKKNRKSLPYTSKIFHRPSVSLSLLVHQVILGECDHVYFHSSAFILLYN